MEGGLVEDKFESGYVIEAKAANLRRVMGGLKEDLESIQPGGEGTGLQPMLRAQYVHTDNLPAIEKVLKERKVPFRRAKTMEDRAMVYYGHEDHVDVANRILMNKKPHQLSPEAQAHLHLMLGLPEGEVLERLKKKNPASHALVRLMAGHDQKEVLKELEISAPEVHSLLRILKGHKKGDVLKALKERRPDTHSLIMHVRERKPR